MPAKKEPLKVFISFDANDSQLAYTLRDALKEKNMEGYLFDLDQKYDSTLHDKITAAINDSQALVAIITKETNSPSVHEEIGYAIASKKSVIIMLEQDATDGVLSHEREKEFFTKEDFGNSCKRILPYLEKLPETTIKSTQDEKELIDNVYIRCYDQLEPIFKKSDFLSSVPRNPWNEISSYWKRKTDSEIKELFEEFEVERIKWQKIWVDFENNFQSKKSELSKILEPIFEKLNLLDHNKEFRITNVGTQDIAGLLYNYREIIFNKEIRNEEELNKILMNHAKRKGGEEYAKNLEDFKRKYPSLFVEIFNKIPEMVEKLNSNYSYLQIDYQRSLLRGKIEFLIYTLEKKFEI